MKKFVMLMTVAAALVTQSAAFANGSRAAIEFEGHRLVQNGRALYEATVLNIDIFEISLYLEHTTHDARVASRCDAPVVVEFKWLRDVSRMDLILPWRKIMRNNAGDNLETQATRIDALMRALPAVNDGDVWRFAYTPEGGTAFQINGQPVTSIPGRDFCQLFVSGHVGTTADDDVRAGLLSIR